MAQNTTPASAEFVASGVSTIGGKFSDQRKYDKSDLIVLKDAAKYPLIPAIKEYGGSGTVTANKFFIFEDEDEPLQFAVGVASTSGGVYETYDDPSVTNAQALQFKVGDLVALDGLYYASGTTSTTTPSSSAYALEHAYVREIGAADSGGAGYTKLVLDRPATSTQIPTTVTLIKTASVMQDGWTAGSGFNIEPSDRYQYVQNVSRVWSLDHNRMAEDSWGEDDGKRLMRRKRESFNRESAYLAWFSRLGLTTLTGGVQRRTMGGIVEFIDSSNVNRLNGPISVNWMNEQSFNWFSRGSMEKYAFIGPQTGIRIDNLEYGALVRNDALAKKIGVQTVKTVELSGGMLHLIVDQSFRGTGLVDGMVILDLDYLKWKHLAGGQPQLWEKIQDGGDHFDKYELWAWQTLWRTFPESHHIVFDITA